MSSTLLLALRLDRRSTTFRTSRLAGLVTITVTGVVYHVALAWILDLDGIHQLANQLVHTVVPLLSVIRWLIFGPRGQTSRRAACVSVLYPLCWLVFTLIRGAVISWYPYPFINVTQLGYGRTILNCFWVSLLLFGLAVGGYRPGRPARSESELSSRGSMTFTARELSREQLSDDRAGRSGVSTDIADGFPEVRHPAVHVEARIWFRADMRSAVKGACQAVSLSPPQQPLENPRREEVPRDVSAPISENSYPKSADACRRVILLSSQVPHRDL